MNELHESYERTAPDLIGCTTPRSCGVGNGYLPRQRYLGHSDCFHGRGEGGEDTYELLCHGSGRGERSGGGDMFMIQGLRIPCGGGDWRRDGTSGGHTW